MLSLKLSIFLRVCILLVVYGAISEDKISDRSNDFGRSCLDLLMEYAGHASNFTKCFIVHARPINVCQQCVHQYTNVVDSYENIIKLEGDIPGEICRAELINVDRLEVIVDTFNSVKNLWKKAMCSKCYRDNSTELNNNTIKILSYLESTKECIATSNRTSHSHEQICNNCSDSYFKLNYFYDKAGSYLEFCMDIIDAMNSSRVQWSGTLGCCTDRQKPEAVFLITVIATLMIPILFYLFVWYCSRTVPPLITYQERWTRRFHQLSVNNS